MSGRAATTDALDLDLQQETGRIYILA